MLRKLFAVLAAAVLLGAGPIAAAQLNAPVEVTRADDSTDGGDLGWG